MNRPASTNATNSVRKHRSQPQARRQFLFGALTLAVFAFLCFFMSVSSTDAPPSPIVAASSQSKPHATTKVRAAYGQLPLSFEANNGQANESVNFLARGAGYTIALSPTEAVFALSRRSDKQSPSGEPSASRRDDNSAAIRALRDADTSNAPRSESPSAMLRMNLIGANREATVAGLDELEGKVNYLIGSDRAKWRANIPTFGRVRYTEVYPGIDVVYYGNQRQLEYDFVVAPGRDAREIALEFAGAERVEVEAATGDLLLTVREATIRQPKPIVYQEVAGVRREVEGGYVLDEGGRVRFALGEYDAALPLVIDPVLVYSTYLGGSGSDSVRGITVDSAGNVFMCGDTTSTNFPTANAFDSTFNTGNDPADSDAFVTKLNASGTALVYSTYLGGTGTNVNLSGDDTCTGIAIDSAGNAYLAGETRSTDFPLANAFDATFGGAFEGYLTKLNAAGNALVYSTYIGGDAFDSSSSVAVDSSNNVYVAGRTTSSDFPTLNPIQATFAGGGSDAFIMKFNAAGSALIYSTYLGGGGGVNNNGFDAAFGLAIDPAGNAYITGPTLSTNFPTASPIQATFGGGTTGGDGYVAKINAAGNALIYSTYLGGSANDLPQHIVADSSGNAYVTGGTESTNFPTANALDSTLGGTQDAFVTKLNPTGSAFVYSTYLGGAAGDGGNDIRVDSSGNAHVAGFTASTDFPTVNPIQAANAGGSNDAFVLKLNAAGSALLFSTYLGGSGADSGFALSVDAASNIYVAGITLSTNFPTLNPVQAANGGGDDAFVTKIDISVTPTTVQFSSSTTTNIQEACTAVQLTVTRSGPTTDRTVVDYATSDGTASQIKDYTIALGRLTFLPGETSKTITLLISEDTFIEGNETFTVTLSNATGGNLGTPSTATVQILDDASEPGGNAIDDREVFVCQQYHDLLMRQPESAGMQFYVNILAGCQPNDTECTKYTRGALAANFFRSPEFQQKGSFILYLYMITLGQRPATAAELNDSTKIDRPHYTEFMMDLRNISDPNGDDKAAVSAMKDALTVAWLLRPEIQTIFGGLTNEQFVKKLESTAGVTLSNESTLIANLNNSTQTRAQVLRAVAESPEVNAKFYRQAFVTMEYFGYLRRDPEDCRNPQNWGGSDANQCGYIFHNNRFNSPVNPDQIENLIVRGFIESPEYRLRFGP